MPNFEEAEKFEKQLNKVVSHARLGALLHKLTGCVGVAAITWATVVLMGGFASDVTIADFVQVTFLVVWIACLLGLALFSSKLVTKKSLYKGSLLPVDLCYSDKWLNGVTIIECVFIAMQFFVFILPCAYFAISSLKRNEFKAIHIVTLLFPPRHTNSITMMSDLKACLLICVSASVSNSTIVSISSCVESCFADVAVFTNLQVCLYTFFWLVRVTCLLACFCLAYIAIECSLWHKREPSLKKYHDEVLSRALNVGIIEADEFDVLEFLFRCLGEDLVNRNIGPLEVNKQNSEAIDYLFNHPKGVEMVYGALSSDDTKRQQTAANIVGFWARRHSLEKNTTLLSKLADKLGLPGKTAEASANSLSALARTKESPLLKIKVASDGGEQCNVVVKVMDLVLRRRLPTLQVYIRLLESFFSSPSVRTWVAENRPQDVKEMKKKLLSIVDQERNVRRNGGPRIDPSIRARTAFLAFSALDYLMEATNHTKLNAALLTPQEAVMQVTPNNLNGDNSQGTTNTDGVRNNAPPNSGNSDRNSHGSNNNINNSSVISGHSTSSDDNDDDDWGSRAKALLAKLDNELQSQEFFWCSEARRYQDLCLKYPPVDNHTCLATWLDSCEIRGEEYENL